MKCILCQGLLSLFYASQAEFSVFSDCRPVKGFPEIYRCEKCDHLQKVSNSEYAQNVTNYYQSYSAYELTSGQEPLKFEAGVPAFRTANILANCSPWLEPLSGTWLDVGTGSGVMPATVSKHFKQFSLAAQDISDSHQRDLEKIEGLKDVFIGPVGSINESFNVISAVHVLEHTFEPHDFVLELKARLKDSGVLLIQVPNVEMNPFDLCVYDHISHFSPQGLAKLLKGHFDYVVLPDKQIQKEITVLASDVPFSNAGKELESATSVDLDLLKEIDDVVCAGAGKHGVFSTGPAGVYVGANLQARLAGFVDEDKNKWGKSLLNTPVFAPETWDKSVPVINPLPKHQALAVTDKFSTLEFVDVKPRHTDNRR